MFAKLGGVDALQAFADLVNRPDGEIELARAAAMIALRDYPDLDLDGLGRRLDAFAAGLDSLEDLRRRLFGELGFTGEAASYHHPDNSFLHRVVERRRGLPIALSILTLEVGRRAGIPLQAIGMPGHFLLRDPLSELYLDAFHQGRLLDVQGCELLFRTVTGAGPDVPFGEFLLPVVGPVQVLERTLGNLAILYRVNADPAGLEWVLRLRLALPEVTGEDLVALGEAVAAQGRAREAAEELAGWADASPELAGALRRHARQLLARLN